MRLLSVFITLFCFSTFSQIGMGEWRLHVPASKAIDVVAGNNRIFSAFESGIFEYDITDDEKRLWTSVNGLSDISPSCLLFDQTTGSVFIGYENGNFDELNNNTVTNIPAIKLAQVQGSKKIHRIVRHEEFLYLATGFAIVKIDPIKDEVKDTYYPTSGNDAILDVTFHNDSVYALSASRLYKGYLADPALSDASAWTEDSRVPVELTNAYADIESWNNDLYILFKTPAVGADSVFRIGSAGFDLLTDLPFSLEMNSLGKHGTELCVNAEGGAFVYNTDGSLATAQSTYSFGGYPSVNHSALYAGYVWLADNNHGLVRYFNEYSALKIGFDGPPKNEFYALDWQEGRLAVVGGGLSSISPTFSGSGLYLFEDEKWSLRDRDNMSMWNGQLIWDFVSVALNPKNTDDIAVGTFSEIPLSVMGSSGQVTDTFTPNNAPLEFTALGGSWSYISGLVYDENEHLWVLNGYSDQPLNVRTKSGTWYSFDCGTAAKNKFSRDLVIDYNGNKWFAMDGAGVFGYKDNGTVSDPSDDEFVNLNSGENTGDLPSTSVNALAVDFDNEIWIGTDNGFAVLYNSEGAFGASPGDYNAQRIKLEYEGNVEYVLGNTSITDIEVDGGNRKWIGTASSGIILLSPDGLEIIEQHTTDNSPLISNTIIDMEIDQNSGELFIVTDKGLISYRANASYEDPEYNSVTVFPNPARPEFQGPITIQGIRYNSDVKITDVAGNLVYKTTSNGGTATWDGKTMNGEKAATGVYLIWTAANDGKGRKVGKVLVVN